MKKVKTMTRTETRTKTRAKARTVGCGRGGRYGVVVRGGVAAEGGREIAKLGRFSSVHVVEFAEGVASGGESVRGKFCAGRGAGGAFV